MKCGARRSDGRECQAPAIRGGSVCRTHGGSAPQVRAAADARLRALVDPAIGVLEASMKRHAKQPQVALAAAKDVLDRTGFKTAEKVEMKHQYSEGAILMTEAFSFEELLEIDRRLKEAAAKRAERKDT